MFLHMRDIGFAPPLLDLRHFLARLAELGRDVHAGSRRPPPVFVNHFRHAVVLLLGEPRGLQPVRLCVFQGQEDGRPGQNFLAVCLDLLQILVEEGELPPVRPENLEHAPSHLEELLESRLVEGEIDLLSRIAGNARGIRGHRLRAGGGFTGGRSLGASGRDRLAAAGSSFRRGSRRLGGLRTGPKLCSGLMLRPAGGSGRGLLGAPR